MYERLFSHNRKLLHLKVILERGWEEKRRMVVEEEGGGEEAARMTAKYEQKDLQQKGR